MTAHIEDVLLWSLNLRGRPYLFGVENQVDDPIAAEDCSELVQNACDAAGVLPAMPDGAAPQWWHCLEHGTELDLDQALETRGALLFVEDLRQPQHSFDRIPHVAFSLGDGTTVEARGRAWGIGTFGSAGRFDLAALIPGVDYSTRPAYNEETFMGPKDVVATLNAPTRLDGHPGIPGVDRWVLQRDGGIITQGDAPFYGSYFTLGIPEPLSFVALAGYQLRIDGRQVDGYVMVDSNPAHAGFAFPPTPEEHP